MNDMMIPSGGMLHRDLAPPLADRVIGTPGTDTTSPHARLRIGDHSIAAEAGLLHRESSNGAAVNVLGGHLQAGAWHDPDGTFHAGVDGSAQVLGAHTPDTWPVVVDGGLLGADVKANVTSKGAEIGAGAYIAQGSVTVQTRNPDRTDDGSVRVGAGWGVGASGRLHYDDVDGDGVREYGFGADVGPFSFDVKTEDPVRAALQAVSPPLGAVLPSGNVTEGVRHTVDRLRSLWP